jgi:hypothetical protein
MAAKKKTEGLKYNYDYNPSITHDDKNDKITQQQVDEEKEEMRRENTKEGANFKVGDKVRSKEQMTDGKLNWVKQYKIDGKGYGGAIAGWGGNGSWGPKEPSEIIEAKLHDGTWYYLLRDSMGYERGYFKESQLQYKKGGMVYHTGTAWLDGTKTAPEAVLNAAQTKAFLKLADHLDVFDTEGGIGGNIMIESIAFHVDSMSSVEDGEKAFDAFVNKFKEIGKQKGVSINTTRLK